MTQEWGIDKCITSFSMASALWLRTPTHKRTAQYLNSHHTEYFKGTVIALYYTSTVKL